MEYKPLMLIIAPVATMSGYGAHSRDIVHSLIKLNKFDIKIWPVRWGDTSHNALMLGDPKDQLIIDRLMDDPALQKQPDICVSILVPNEFYKTGKFNIGITAGTESTIAPAEWISGMNAMDLNIVPSKFAKSIFEQSVFTKTDNNTKQILEQLKVNKPIEVLHEGVDSLIYKRSTKISKSIFDEFKNINESFLYLFVGHWLPGNLGHDRKDVGMLLKLFFETFKNKVRQPGLLLKISGGPISIVDYESISKKIYQIKQSVKANSLPNVYLLYGDLTDEEMNSVYNHPKVKAMVSLTHGEGYGRPLAEFSSSSGKPIIASNWSGHTDFLDKNLVVLLPGDLTEIPDGSIPKGIWVRGSKWFTVNYQQASKFLNDMFFNYKKYTLNARKQQQVIRGKYSLDSMTKQLNIILNKYLPKFQEKTTLKLPKLKRINELENSKHEEIKNSPQFAKMPKLKKL